MNTSQVAGLSPSLRTKKQGLGNTSTRKSKANSPSRKTSIARKAAAEKKAASGENAKESKEEEKSLTSPTSIQMASSFIIKNADQSFDTYYHQMKRRKAGGHDTSFAGNTTLGQSTKFGVVLGKMPTARDGHSSVIDQNGVMYLFGGDRHHMPFNDLYTI